ncbi:MAG: protein kinase [Polyangiaceae bacterium]|nr:protein kinase [Polyangiaceae bacterium]
MRTDGLASLMDPAPGRDLVGAVLDGRYRVERRIGGGGMGTVWEVEHVESLQRLALKTLALPLDEATRERFLREARAAAALETRHVVRITDARMGYVHQGEPLPFLVMELLRGDSLGNLLSVRGRLSFGEVVWVIRQVGRALGLAHARGIVHRDLKPANLIVAIDDGSPIVKLCDFGVAKLVGDSGLALARTNAPTTGTGAMLGTPLYMAPEQLRGNGRVEPATDQWALGVLVFRSLARREYFGDVGTTTELVLRIAQDPLQPPSELEATLTPAFDRWFLRSLARDPSERFRDVRAQVAALEIALGRPQPVPLHPGHLGGKGAQPGGLVTGPTADVSAAVLPERGRAREVALANLATPGHRLRATLAALLVLTGGALWGLGTWLPRWLAPPSPSPTAGQGAGESAAPITVGSSPPSVSSPPAPLVTPVGSVAAMAVRVPSSALPERSVGPAPGVESLVTSRSSTITSGGRAAWSGTSATPVASASAPRPSPPLLGASAPCNRSAECASGLCVAETCR